MSFAAPSEILDTSLEIFLRLLTSSGQMKSKGEYLFTQHAQ